jgi:cephalosporin hydroxylase
MDNVGIENGRVISIDTGDQSKADHLRIKELKGKSTSPLILKWINEEIRPNDKVMVVLDSDHSTENVMNEMRIYAPLVTSRCYMVVMDSNLGGNPVVNLSVPGPGPMQAIEMFMKGNGEWEIDREREKFYFTFCPSGFLRRKA